MCIVAYCALIHLHDVVDLSFCPFDTNATFPPQQLRQVRTDCLLHTAQHSIQSKTAIFCPSPLVPSSRSRLAHEISHSAHIHMAAWLGTAAIAMSRFIAPIVFFLFSSVAIWVISLCTATESFIEHTFRKMATLDRSDEEKKTLGLGATKIGA